MVDDKIQNEQKRKQQQQNREKRTSQIITQAHLPFRKSFIRPPQKNEFQSRNDRIPLQTKKA